MEKEALLYQKNDDLSVECHLCAHCCTIKPGKAGICQVRENKAGELYTLAYGNLIAQHADPIEKKPLYHFLPGSRAWSIASPGCNFRCQWCQNWEISQLPRYSKEHQRNHVEPAQVIEDAIAHGCQSIAFTYTEPTVFFEYTLDVAKLAKNVGLRTIYVTNGYMTSEMIEMIAPWLDAANVDIKSFNEQVYRKSIGAHLQPVLDACIELKNKGIWLEVTTLLVPGINDDLEEIKSLAEFIFNDLGKETPWHISRYFPAYQLNEKLPTSGELMDAAKMIGKNAGLQFVYEGNISGDSATYCPVCGSSVIRREGFTAKMIGMDSFGRCIKCGTDIAGRFK